MEKEDDFTKQLVDYLAEIEKNEDNNEYQKKSSELSTFRGIFIQYTTMFEDCIELLIAIYLMGNNWERIDEFRYLMFNKDSDLNFKIKTFNYILKNKFPKYHASLKKEHATFIKNIPERRNQFAHYFFKFKPQKGQDKVRLHHITIQTSENSKIPHRHEKELIISQTIMEQDNGQMWLAVIFVKRLIIKLAFNKPDDTFKIKSEELQIEMPDYIRRIGMDYVTKK